MLLLGANAIIIVECNPDEFLVRLLGFSKIKHAGGKGKVLEKIKENRGSIGIIDEDPDSRQSKERNEYVENESIANIKLLVNKHDESQRVIQISPRLEDWILHLARQNQIHPTKFGLPNDADKLHTPHIEKKRNFQEFMNNIVEKDGVEISMLKKWLTKASQD
jgi:hypothetical protein